MDDGNFCHCCQRQIPNMDEDLYSLWNNLDLGELGEGFPILFQLMKYINWTLLLMIIFYFIPAIALISASVNHYGKDKTKNFEPLTLYSFGAFLKFMNPNNLVQFDDRENYIIGYCVGLALGIVVTFIIVQIIRKKLSNDVKLVD